MKERKKKRSGPYDEEFYKKRSINDLILLGIYSIGENNEKCTFERLIKECFTLFPKSFGFSQYPKWPDSNKIGRPLRTLRKRKLIIGNPNTIFSLTKTGRKIAEETVKTLRQRRLKF